MGKKKNRVKAVAPPIDESVKLGGSWASSGTHDEVTVQDYMTSSGQAVIELNQFADINDKESTNPGDDMNSTTDQQDGSAADGKGSDRGSDSAKERSAEDEFSVPDIMDVPIANIIGKAGSDDTYEHEAAIHNQDADSVAVGSEPDDLVGDGEAEVGDREDSDESEDDNSESEEHQDYLEEDVVQGADRVDEQGYEEYAEANADAPSEDGWVLYQTADGYDYYYNHYTGESQWASVGNDENSYHSQERYDQQYSYDDSSQYHSPLAEPAHHNPSSPIKQQHRFYDPSTIQSPHQAAGVSLDSTSRTTHNSPSVTFYHVPKQRSPNVSRHMSAYPQEEYNVGAYEAERHSWDQDTGTAPSPSHSDETGSIYDEEAGVQYSDGNEGNDASSEGEDFNQKFANFLQSAAGQKAFEEEKNRIERKTARIARKKLKEDARRIWLASREKEKESDDDIGSPSERGLRREQQRYSGELNQRSRKANKRRAHWEVDDAEQGMSYFSGRDTGSSSSVMSSGTTSTDDDDVSSDDSDVEAMLAPVIPSQLTSTNAAIEALRPMQFFIFRFIEVGVEVTKEVAGTVWEHSSAVASRVSETAVAYGLETLTKSIEIIQRHGGETYNMINEAVIQFVEADIEHRTTVQLVDPAIHGDPSAKEASPAEDYIEVKRDIVDSDPQGISENRESVLGAERDSKIFELNGMTG